MSSTLTPMTCWGRARYSEHFDATRNTACLKFTASSDVRHCAAIWNGWLEAGLPGGQLGLLNFIKTCKNLLPVYYEKQSTNQCLLFTVNKFTTTSTPRVSIPLWVPLADRILGMYLWSLVVPDFMRGSYRKQCRFGHKHNFYIFKMTRIKLHTLVEWSFLYKLTLFKIVSPISETFAPPMNPLLKSTLDKFARALLGPVPGDVFHLASVSSKRCTVI